MASVDWHRLAFLTYRKMPRPLQRVVRSVYEENLRGSRLTPNYRRGFVRRFFDGEEEFESFVEEFERSGIRERIEASRAEHRRLTGHGRFAAINTFTHTRLYALVRKLRPETVVETGVCNGVSTYIVLEALEMNDRGHLYSADYPDPDRIPDGMDPGWIIPDELRSRWTLNQGLSQEELPDMVSAVESIDLFIHDTKADILDKELEIVWPKLVDGAVVTADDVHQSDVFSEVKRTRNVEAGYVAPNVGYLIKRG